MTRSPIELVDWTAKVLQPLNPLSVIVFGSSVMGGFDPLSSDVDLVIVFDETQVQTRADLEFVLRSLSRFGIDGFMLPYDHISSDRPTVFYPTRNESRVLQPIEILLIRDHSRVLVGSDPRKFMWQGTHDVASFISLHYFLDRVEWLVSNHKLHSLEERTVLDSYCRAAVRKLAELHTLEMSSKASAFDWLATHLASKGEQYPLATLNEQFVAQTSLNPLSNTELRIYLCAICSEISQKLSEAEPAIPEWEDLPGTIHAIRAGLKKILPDGLPAWFLYK